MRPKGQRRQVLWRQLHVWRYVRVNYQLLASDYICSFHIGKSHHPNSPTCTVCIQYHPFFLNFFCIASVMADFRFICFTVRAHDQLILLWQVSWTSRWASHANPLTEPARGRFPNARVRKTLRSFVETPPGEKELPRKAPKTAEQRGTDLTGHWQFDG